jgi:hypothetical protein
LFRDGVDPVQKKVRHDFPFAGLLLSNNSIPAGY